MRSLPALLVTVGAVLQATAGVAAAAAFDDFSFSNNTFSFSDYESRTTSIARRDGTLPPLRIMPLGASIVAGIGSHPRNGSGNCKGPLCQRGGNCVGGACKESGSCEGPLCRQGGYCGPLGKDCLKGACIGSSCLPFGGIEVPELDAAFVDPQDPKWSRSTTAPMTTRTSIDDAACPTRTPYSDCTTTCVAAATGSGCARTSVACNTKTGCGTPTAIITTFTPVALGLQ
ncbi:hypothetical protein BJX62DRAFT_245079 [Aspergillus germanicus]